VSNVDFVIHALHNNTHTNACIKVCVGPDLGSNTRSTAVEMRMLTITTTDTVNKFAVDTMKFLMKHMRLRIEYVLAMNIPDNVPT
jgi:hypothetical protein